MKSPFIIIKDLLSPMECVDITENVEDSFPDKNPLGQSIKTERYSKLIESRTMERLHEVATQVEKHYDVEYEGITTTVTEWYPQQCEQEKHICSNSSYIGSQWVRQNDYDFTGIIFLKNYNNQPPLDDTYEVYGGKLEFPNFEFSVNPEMGTLILFPGTSNFIYRTLSPEVGDMVQLKFHIGTTPKYEFDINKFKGTYKDWFNNMTTGEHNE